MTDAAGEGASKTRNMFPLCAGIVVYAVVLAEGNRLLLDPDIYWQIAVGQWIVDHRAVPWTDIYSFTMQGKPWMSSQWLALVFYGQTYAWFGWAGPVIVASLATALAYMIVARFLVLRLGVLWVLPMLALSLLIARSHLYARPHVLALPVMVAWVCALLSAAERRQAPSLVVAALMALWVNLHGGFIFGLLLIAPIAADAALGADSSERWRLLRRWFLFGIVATAACCVTPYGWNAFRAAHAILDLGTALKLIREWAPLDFGIVGPIQIGIFLIFACVLFGGVKLPLTRNVLFVGLLYMAMAHFRNADVFALLAPLVVATPLADQFGAHADKLTWTFPRRRNVVLSGAAMVFAGMTIFACVAGRYHPGRWIAPEAAVAALKANRAKRIFNDYNFGGYMISKGLAPYIDGRAELYGEKFALEYNAARQLLKPGVFLDLLARHGIDATLLSRNAPAARMLDHLDGWQKIFIDDRVVVHVRDADAVHSADPEIKPTSN